MFPMPIIVEYQFNFIHVSDFHFIYGIDFYFTDGAIDVVVSNIVSISIPLIHLFIGIQLSMTITM